MKSFLRLFVVLVADMLRVVNTAFRLIADIAHFLAHVCRDTATGLQRTAYGESWRGAPSHSPYFPALLAWRKTVRAGSRGRRRLAVAFDRFLVRVWQRVDRAATAVMATARVRAACRQERVKAAAFVATGSLTHSGGGPLTGYGRAYAESRRHFEANAPANGAASEHAYW